MDVSHILDNLNDAQREAVCTNGHSLVLAGAGSGKTRVLVHRIAWLLEVERVSPFGVLAVTFTNKAANEMRLRIENLIRLPMRGLWVGTFHGIAHRLLRLHYRDAKLPEHFQILDADDQFRLLKRLQKDLQIDDGVVPPRQTQWYINHHKEHGRRSKNIDPGTHNQETQMWAVYEAYEQHCQRSGLVDFSELLLRSHELWLENATLLEHYQQRFAHILVDEFQDTNTIQYAWLRVLAGDQATVFVVGDDDQSIYGWRGAKVEHVHQFQRDFPSPNLIRLEQNYRSSGNILNAANALIDHNESRLGKNLWTAAGEGELIDVYAAFHEVDEAQYVVDQIQSWHDQGQDLHDAAILYRSHAQSRVFEQTLLQKNIPYRVFGGLRFFERQEIKDTLAYLRLITNRDDDAAYERVVNTPTRGIGERTLAVVRARAQQSEQSLWQSSLDLVQSDALTARARNALAGFLTLVDGLEHDVAEHDLATQVELTIETAELIPHYEKEPSERAETRKENLQELMTAARHFVVTEEHEDMPELVAFLSSAALEAGEAQADAGQDCVQLMTLHAAKGLEFPLVFLCGLEDGVFPHERSLDSADQLEEERRLCYVGITRAQHHLHMSFAEVRRMHGKDQRRRPSRFLLELPAELLHEIRPKLHVTRSHQPPPSMASHSPDIALGQMVEHPRFGTGVVIDSEGAGGHARVQINFELEGTKWLVLAHANLEIL